jgi:hypothetical protein
MESITTTQQIPYTIAPTDRKGRPAPVENVVWASSNTEVATVTASEDGLTGLVVGLVPGAVTISVTADADMGEGVTELAGVAELTVTPAAAVSVTLVAGPVAEQPEA